jgi:hypothetical protein
VYLYDILIDNLITDELHRSQMVFAGILVCSLYFQVLCPFQAAELPLHGRIKQGYVDIILYGSVQRYYPFMSGWLASTLASGSTLVFCKLS